MGVYTYMSNDTGTWTRRETRENNCGHVDLVSYHTHKALHRALHNTHIAAHTRYITHHSTHPTTVHGKRYTIGDFMYFISSFYSRLC